MKLIGGDLDDVAFVLDFRFVVSSIDKPCAGKHGRDTERVAHRRNENDARDQCQV